MAEGFSTRVFRSRGWWRVGLAVMDRVEDGPNGRESAGVRTPGAGGDERWGVLAAGTGRRGIRRSRGRVRGVGDDAVGKEVQALEDGGDHGRISPSLPAFAKTTAGLRATARRR